MNDLVNRLRTENLYWHGPPDVQEKAADRIEKLERALREIETLELDPRNSGQMWVEALRQIARAALEEKNQ